MLSSCKEKGGGVTTPSSHISDVTSGEILSISWSHQDDDGVSSAARDDVPSGLEIVKFLDDKVFNMWTADKPALYFTFKLQSRRGGGADITGWDEGYRIRKLKDGSCEALYFSAPFRVPESLVVDQDPNAALTVIRDRVVRHANSYHDFIIKSK